MDAFNNVKWSAGGRQYPALEKLLKDCSPEVERELYRLAQDIEAEKRLKRNGSPTSEWIKNASMGSGRPSKRFMRRLHNGSSRSEKIGLCGVIPSCKIG